MANEFVVRNGLISLDSSAISGSLTVTQGITSSLFGTSSWSSNSVSASRAQTASFALNANSSSYALSASRAETSSFALNANSSSFALSASWAPVAGTTVFPFTGSALFTGSIILTGSIFLSQGSIIFSGSQYSYSSVGSSTGNAPNVISSVSTGSFRAAFYNYVLFSGSNARAGQVSCVWFINTASFAETLTTDIGNTSQVEVFSRISGSFVQLVSTSSLSGWTIEASVNLI